MKRCSFCAAPALFFPSSARPMEIHAETRCCTKLEICAEDMQHVIPVMSDHQLVDKVRWAQLWESDGVVLVSWDAACCTSVLLGGFLSSIAFRIFLPCTPLMRGGLEFERMVFWVFTIRSGITRASSFFEDVIGQWERSGAVGLSTTTACIAALSDSSSKNTFSGVCLVQSCYLSSQFALSAGFFRCKRISCSATMCRLLSFESCSPQP